MLESFTGRELAEEVKDNINHPCNAFNAQSDTHESYDKLAWGIEAVHHDDEVYNKSQEEQTSDIFLVEIPFS